MTEQKIVYKGWALDVDPFTGHCDNDRPMTIDGTFTLVSDPGDGYRRVKSDGGLIFVIPADIPGTASPTR